MYGGPFVAALAPSDPKDPIILYGTVYLPSKQAKHCNMYMYMYMYGGPFVAALAPSDPNGHLAVVRPAPTPTFFCFCQRPCLKWPKPNGGR